MRKGSTVDKGFIASSQGDGETAKQHCSLSVPWFTTLHGSQGSSTLGFLPQPCHKSKVTLNTLYKGGSKFQRRAVTCPKSHNKEEAELGLEQSWFCLEAWGLVWSIGMGALKV